MEKIILVGLGGHGKSVIDCIEKMKAYEIVGYTDISAGTGYRGYKYLGNDDVLQKYYDEGIRYAFVSVGYMGKGTVRQMLYEKLKRIGYMLPVIRDASAIVSNNIQIGEGSFIGKGAILNSDVVIGKMCIINSGAIIEHECRIDNFTHISVGAVLCGNVKVGEASFVGANATVLQGRNIGNDCIVGAGEVIRREMEDMQMFYRNSLQTIVGGVIPFGKREAA